jgi:hypothetical protein
LARVRGGGSDSPAELELVACEAVPVNMAIVDAPDIDSVVEANRDLAVQLLSAADLWIFVTTAARYADAVPWEMLRQSVERGISVAVVLDRVPPDAMHEVRVHLATMLSDRGLSNAPMFTIPETRTIDGFLPPEVVAPLLAWLTRLARDRRSRDVVIRRTLDGTLNSLRPRVLQLADAADGQWQAHATLQAELDAIYASARYDLSTQLSDGSLLRGEVLARWQDFVGAGDSFQNVESALSRARERLNAVLGHGADATAELGEALRTGVQAMVRSRLQAAAEQVSARWREHPGGVGMLAARDDLRSVATDFDDRLGRQVQQWQAGLLELVRTESQNRRATARAVSIGVNGTSAILMLVACSQAVDPAGPDLGVATGTATIAQRLLQAVLGDQAARSLATNGLEDLRRRVDALAETERGRHQVQLDGAGVQTGSGAGLRSAVTAVEAAH